MSDNIPPTVELLVTELKNVTNWYVFGATLGIPVSKLDCIKKDYSDVEDQKVQMFQFWLQYKLDASWKLLIQALEQNNYLVLAAELSKRYLLSDSSNTSEEVQQEKSTSTEVIESTAEVRATAAVVERLRDLETSFTNMLTNLLRLLTECKCDLSQAQFFLDDQFDTEKFSQCTNFNALLRQLRRAGHVDTFNTYYLKQLVAFFKKDQLTEHIKEYEAEKEDFLKDTTVIEFQHAVVSRVEPVNPSQMKDLTIKISKELAKDRTLKDIEKLALRAFGENQREFVRIHVKLGSVIISVFFPETLTGKLEQLAHENAAVFKDAGVEEVSVDGRVVFPSTLEEEDIPTALLKEIYINSYHLLVEAVSDEHTCQSLLTQLSSSALISEEKIARLTSSKVTGSLFLKTLGLEEKPHLLVPLVSAMSGVDKLQELTEKVSIVLRSKQRASLGPDVEKPLHVENAELEQCAKRIAQLDSDKADLLTRLHCCEEELKTANELSMMREKAILDMMAAVHRRDTDVEEREESISLLKKELEELRREGVERESLLTREIEDLKSKLMTKTDGLNEAIERNSELSSQEKDKEKILTQLQEKLLQQSKEISDLLNEKTVLKEQHVRQIQAMAELSGTINDKQQKIDAMQQEMWDLKKEDFKLAANLRHSIAGEAVVSHESPETVLDRFASDHLILPRDDIGGRGKKINNGNFGEVYEARLVSSNQRVAVKACKTSHSDAVKCQFLYEADILRHYEHPNIVKLIGVVPHHGEEPLCIVMEFVGWTFEYFLQANGRFCKTEELTEMCAQVCTGMEYLEKNDCVHRSLAARNCLVSENKIVKISNFGTSHGRIHLDPSDSKLLRPAPIKWTAPEALMKNGKYTSASDVWSFGVLLWETFSFGNEPYPGIAENKVKEKVKKGYRMRPPADCPPTVFTIMNRCWEYDPKDRPTFAELLDEMRKCKFI